MKFSPKKIYLLLPSVIQVVVINCVGLVKNLIRYSGVYNERLEDYRSFYQSGSSDLTLKKRDAQKKYWNLIRLEFGTDAVLCKSFVKDNSDFFTSFKNRWVLTGSTSGSSGNGLSFFKTFASEQDTWAAYDAFREHHGVTKKSWCGYFCGNMVFSPKSDGNICAKVFTTRQLIFSQYHLNNSTISKYLHVLNTEKPEWIHGYPSFLLELVRLAQAKGISLVYSPKLVTTGSENLNSSSKIILKDFFKTQVRDLYCQSEMVAMIYECRKGNLHVNSAFSDVDFLEASNGQFKVVGSNFNNTSLPLLNYDTDDLVTLSESEFKCSCGNSSPVISSIDGRSEDSLILPDGSRLGRLDHVLKGFDAVYGAQFIQCRSSLETTLNIIVDSDRFNKNKLERVLKEYIPLLHVEVVLVSEINAEDNGKIRFVKVL